MLQACFHQLVTKHGFERTLGSSRPQINDLAFLLRNSRFEVAPLRYRQGILASKKVNQREAPCRRLAVQVILNHIDWRNASTGPDRGIASTRRANALNGSWCAKVIFQSLKRPTHLTCSADACKQPSINDRSLRNWRNVSQ